MPFHVASDKFSGPLELLLEIIEEEHLSITEVSLAQITESYLQYINTHEPPPDELADFLIVATKLLLIKSRTILPKAGEPEEDASTLALQLRMYKEFVEASKHLEAIFDNDKELFAREKADVVKQTEVIVAGGLTPTALQESFAKLLKQLQPFFALKQVAMERVISVKERLEEIRSAILERSRMTFSDIVGNGRSKVDVVISFLALLELVKQRVVYVVQDKSFHEIEIKRVD